MIQHSQGGKQCRADFSADAQQIAHVCLFDQGTSRHLITVPPGAA